MERLVETALRFKPLIAGTLSNRMVKLVLNTQLYTQRLCSDFMKRSGNRSK